MVLGASASSGSGKVSTKRLLFSKPSWSKSQNLGSSQLFHRSEQVYVGSTSGFERRRRERIIDKGFEGSSIEEHAEYVTKRRRIMDEDANNEEEENGERVRKDDEEEDDDGDDKDDDDSVGAGDVSRNQTQSDFFAKPKHALLRTGVNATWENCGQPNANLCKIPSATSVFVEQNGLTKFLSQKEEYALKSQQVVDLDDDIPENSSGPLTIESINDKTAAAQEDDDFLATDDEFAELTRKARERARSKRIEDLPSSLSNISTPAECKTTIRSPSTAFSPADPTLQILITSSIPNTTPLIVSRKLSQRLKDVRTAWADRQHFSGDFSDQVFLTWRGKRLFDVTTCKSLGVAVDSVGRILAKDDVLGDEEGRIHMEAMTLEIFSSRKSAKKESAAKSENPKECFDIQKEFNKQPDDQIRIILKAQKFEELKLKVKAVTPISKIINAFRHANNIDVDNDVYIMFEGRRLESGSTVEDAEITDLDTLDTYVK